MGEDQEPDGSPGLERVEAVIRLTPCSGPRYQAGAPNPYCSQLSALHRLLLRTALGHQKPQCLNTPAGYALPLGAAGSHWLTAQGDHSRAQASATCKSPPASSLSLTPPRPPGITISRSTSRDWTFNRVKRIKAMARKKWGLASEGY